MENAFRSRGCAMEIKIAPTAPMKHHAVSIEPRTRNSHHTFFISSSEIKFYNIIWQMRLIKCRRWHYNCIWLEHNSHIRFHVGIHATDYNLLHIECKSFECIEGAGKNITFNPFLSFCKRETGWGIKCMNGFFYI